MSRKKIKVTLYTHPHCPFSSKLRISSAWRAFEEEMSNHATILKYNHFCQTESQIVEKFPTLFISLIEHSCSNLDRAAETLRVKTQNVYSAKLQNVGNTFLISDIWNIIGAYMAFFSQ